MQSSTTTYDYDYDYDDDYYHLQLCQGDCDIDGHCQGDLICWQRDGDADVPGCKGAAVPDHDYCVVNPSELPPLTGDDETPVTSPLLKACQGDCDATGNWCDEGLTCFQRDGFDKVPGCSGFGKRNFDYCVTPP